MNTYFTGRVWLFGDDISTDHIIPGRFFHLRSDLDALAQHAMEDCDTEFTSKAQPGDILVAGKNFGQGSSREFAALVLKQRGIQAILAVSFARIFYRNAVNVGLAPIICDTSGFYSGDQIIIELELGRIDNTTREFKRTFSPLPDFMRAILDDGGLVSFISKHGIFELKTNDENKTI